MAHQDNDMNMTLLYVINSIVHSFRLISVSQIPALFKENRMPIVKYADSECGSDDGLC